jgi:hypothetical protein
MDTSPDTEAIMLMRSAAHVSAEPAPDARFRHGITDRMMATLMYALEAGTEIWRSESGRWYAPAANPLGSLSSLVVQEAIRTGLVVHFTATRELPDRLVPALTHLDASGRSACRTAGEGLGGPKRVRLVPAPIAVDCLVCLDQL